MKVRILKPVTGLYGVGVAPGSETEIPNKEKALRMIETGHAEAVAVKPVEKRETRTTKKKKSIN